MRGLKKNRARQALFLSLLLPSLAARAAEAPVRADGPEITDQVLEDMKAKSKEALLKKTAEIEKTHADREAFAKFLKDQRLAFEKRLSDEMVSFLASLKPLPPAERRKALSAFTEKQRLARDEFSRQSRAKIDEFRRRNAESN